MTSSWAQTLQNAGIRAAKWWLVRRGLWKNQDAAENFSFTVLNTVLPSLSKWDIKAVKTLLQNSSAPGTVTLENKSPGTSENAQKSEIIDGLPSKQIFKEKKKPHKFLANGHKSPTSWRYFNLEVNLN